MDPTSSPASSLPDMHMHRLPPGPTGRSGGKEDFLAARAPQDRWAAGLGGLPVARGVEFWIFKASACPPRQSLFQQKHLGHVDQGGPETAARRRRSLSGSLWLAGSSRLTSRRTRSGRQRGQRAPPPHFAPATAHLACDPSHRRLRTSPCPLGPHRGALPVAIQGRGGRVHGDRGAGRALGAKRTQPPQKVGTRELRVGRRDPQLFKADTGTRTHC